MSIISIEITDDLKAQLEAEAKELDMSLNELIEKVLNGFIRTQKMNRLQKRLNPHFKAMGIDSEEDLFKIVS